MRIILRVEDKEIDYENNRSKAYYKWLEKEGIADTLENYLDWGLVLLFWGDAIKILAIEADEGI